LATKQLPGCQKVCFREASSQSLETLRGSFPEAPTLPTDGGNSEAVGDARIHPGACHRLLSEVDQNKAFVTKHLEANFNNEGIQTRQFAISSSSSDMIFVWFHYQARGFLDGAFAEGMRQADSESLFAIKQRLVSLQFDDLQDMKEHLTAAHL
jgi:hypothetical protein